MIPSFSGVLKLDDILEGDLKARPLTLLDLILVEIEIVDDGLVCSSFD